MTASEIIQQLNLTKHPEGGWFKEVYRSSEHIKQSALPPRFTGNRSYSTSIYFLLEGHEFSAFHKIKSDELWHFYEGSAITIHILDEVGNYTSITIGKNLNYQCTVPNNCWFAAEVLDKNSFALVGCTVSPVFNFSDFELAKRDELRRLYPEFAGVIDRFTRLKNTVR